MARRRKPYWGAGPYEHFRQNVVERFRNFDRDAREHVIGRNQSVAQVLNYMNLLHNVGLIPAESRIVSTGALWQALSGSRLESIEGAHCLPCQLLVLPPGATKGIDPSELPNLTKAVRKGMRSEFAHVTNLPALFNSADVVAERCPLGLREVFACACQRVVRAPRRPKEHRLIRLPGNEMFGEFRDVWMIDRDAVRDAYRTTWVPQAELAYERALDEVQEGRLERYLAPLGRRAEPALVMEVLSAYLKHHRADEPSKLLDRQMEALEHEFNSGP